MARRKKEKTHLSLSLSFFSTSPKKQSRSRRRLRRLQKQAWNPPLSHPLLRKAALVQQHEKACYEASTSFTVDADCCFEQTRRPSPAERAAAAAAAASAVLTSSDFPPAARARVAARWFAGAYSGVEPASVSSKTVTIAKEKKNEAVKKPAPAAKPAAATRPKSASRPASAASSRRNGGKRPASARSSRRPVSSSGSRT